MEEIEKKSGQDLSLCYQCGKCSAGCPIGFEMDYMPNQIIRLLQLGDKETVLNSKTIWLCSSCNTCTTRCPKDVDLAKVMDALRIIAHQEGIKAKVPEVETFNNIFLKMIERYGRLYEMGLLGILNIATLKPFKDIFLGPPMFMKGKLGLFPHKTKNTDKVKKIFKRVRRLEKDK